MNNLYFRTHFRILEYNVTVVQLFWLCHDQNLSNYILLYIEKRYIYEYSYICYRVCFYFCCFIFCELKLRKEKK